MTTSPEPSHSAGGSLSDLVGELYEAHGRMVVGLCRFLLRDRGEAEDAAQQVFVAAHHSLLRGSHPRDAPAWLATIARNECRARIKRRMREPLALVEPDDEPGTESDPFSAAVRRADLRAVGEELVRLPRAQRHAFVLREFAGLSYDEVALALGVSGSAVESLLVRARFRLRLVLTRANPLFLPLVVRDQVTRLALGADEGSTGAVSKLVSLPFAAKLAAAGAGVALVTGGGTALKGFAPAASDPPRRFATSAAHLRAEAPDRTPIRHGTSQPAVRLVRAPVASHQLGSSDRRHETVRHVTAPREQRGGETSERRDGVAPTPLTDIPEGPTHEPPATPPSDDSVPADVAVTSGDSGGPAPAVEDDHGGTTSSLAETSSPSGSGSGDSGSGDSGSGGWSSGHGSGGSSDDSHED